MEHAGEQGAGGGDDMGLVHAAGRGDEAETRRLLAAGLDGRAWRPRDQALVEAAQVAAGGGHIGCLAAIVDAGVDLDHSTKRTALEDDEEHEARSRRGVHLGKTAAMRAAQEDCDQCLGLLIRRGADVDALMDEGGVGALFFACQSNHPKCVRLLIDAGADLDRRGGLGGFGAIHWAVHGRGGECLAMLVGAGADVELLDDYGVTPLMYASADGVVKCVEQLLGAGVGLDARDEDGRSAHDYALQRGQASVVGLLGARRATIEADLIEAAAPAAGRPSDQAKRGRI